MDSQDNEKIQQLLKTLKRNQVTIFQQLDNQYSVNSEIINKFNETILDIKHNEQTLLGRIDLLNLMLAADSKNFEILFAENLLNQIIHLFNIILDLTRDIRTSLTFCGTNTVHPSIITNQELAKEMTKLNSKYADELPFKINENNIQKYLKLIKPNCRIVETEIVYFLTLPLFDPKQYRLFHLFPVPNVHFQAIIPSSKYFIKYESGLVPLSDACSSVDGLHLCQTLTRSLSISTCEKEIILDNNFEQCSYVQLPTDESLEYLPDIDQYLAVLPQTSTLESRCPHAWTKKTVKGVFLLSGNLQCEIILNSRILLFNDSLHSRPAALEFNMDLQVRKREQLPKLQLRNLQLTKLSQNIPVARPNNPYVSTWHVSSTMLLYCIILVTACFTAYKYFSVKKCFRKTPKPDPNLDSIAI
jgi:hypothetical protein